MGGFFPISSFAAGWATRGEQHLVFVLKLVGVCVQRTCCRPLMNPVILHADLSWTEMQTMHGLIIEHIEMHAALDTNLLATEPRIDELVFEVRFASMSPLILILSS